MVRKHLNYSTHDMSHRLGLHRTGYYKNENGDTMPGIDTLYQLQKDFNISMDWLLFGRGAMIIRNQQAAAPTTQVSPEVAEMIEDMNRDSLLKYEIMAFYLKKAGKK